ncbi:MAG: zinc ABC transporter substrate-binding protein [Proteobacteria bacterium]|nr:zinc ABC transporter substrate-binding protein [Pseudomonadota bacterium]
MKNVLLCLSALVLFVPSVAMAEIKVVATLPTLGAIARAIGGEDVKVETLATPTEDPHYVDPRPDYVLKLSRADLLIYNGMELEIGWLPALQKNSRNTKVLDNAPGAFDASRFITPIDVPTTKVDRSQGDIHAQGNPHYIYALPEAVLVASALANKYSQIDPEHAENYKNRLAQFKSTAKAKDAAYQKRFSELSSHQIITYHESMGYLNKWLKLEQIGTIEPKPGVAPSPSHVAQLVGKLKNTQVTAIIQETFQPKATSEKIAKLLNIKVVAIEPGPRDDEDYFVYLDRTIDSFFK